MKLKLNLYYSAFNCDYDNFENLEIEARTGEYESDYEVRFKSVTVELPDNTGLTETQFKKAYYLKHLSLAELEVKTKRDELTRAEEVVKNMMAIEHNPN